MITEKVDLSGPGADFTIERYRQKLETKPGDCGIDLYPLMSHDKDYTYVNYGSISVLSIPTGLRILVPAGYFAWITGRSSSWDKLRGFDIIPGVIDSGYTGEYRVRVQVDARYSAIISEICHDLSVKRQALAQAIILPFVRMDPRKVDSLENTGRGEQGYGSTDRNA